ncbi:Hypp4440 [Branchiostoma lanceolatum]|uniref:Hypp4440 protein n=1 Tax=Branchiostoma lanceolatum TaxID=7740 RepID=A0A8K0AAF9_BRALA|nr:Hypp4440 [Branchiostoma lanceolatum]
MQVEDSLDTMAENVHKLSDAAKREVQRRTDAEEEFTAVLPPDVVSILTQVNQAEREREERHQEAHRKFAETIRKFFQKLQMEENKYKDRMQELEVRTVTVHITHKYRDRMQELEGAMNPDAEATVLQRYRQAKSRLQAEL